jgi:hypothetical protein
MNERPVLDYSKRTKRSPRPRSVWFAYFSCAIGLHNLIWMMFACAGAAKLSGGTLFYLTMAGILAGAPIGVALGLIAALSKDRTPLGWAGAVLNLPHTIMALGIVVFT